MPSAFLWPVLVPYAPSVLQRRLPWALGVMKHHSADAITQVPRLVRQLYEVVGEFEALFRHTKKKFTPDGHLVGSIGEVVAAYMYDLVLHPNSKQLHDAETHDGKQIQIKATQGTKKVALRGKPDHLIVLQLTKSGEALEVFNGPGELVLEHCGERQDNGQSSISLSKLRALMSQVPASLQVARAKHGA